MMVTYFPKELTGLIIRECQRIQFNTRKFHPMLKWYHIQFSLKTWCNSYIFQRIAIYNDEWQINDNVICQN